MGDLALHFALDARLETKKKTSSYLPDALPRDAGILPLWDEFSFGNWLGKCHSFFPKCVLAIVATAVFGAVVSSCRVFGW